MCISKIFRLLPFLSISFAEHQRLAGSADGEQNNADGGECNAAKPSGGPPPLPPFDLPTSLVKKIACMDSEVDRMTADAVRAMAKATSLFIGLLATKAYTHAAHLKRKNFKFSDIEAVASKDRRMGDMGLPQTLREDAVFQEVHGRADAENQNRTANKNKRDAIKTGEGDGEEVKEKIRPLTDFFATSGATTGALLSVHALEETAEDEEV